MGDETLCRRCQSRPRAPGDGQTMCARCLEASEMNRARVRLHKVPLRGALCTMVESESIAALVDRQPADRAESAADYDPGDLVLEALHRALEPDSAPRETGTLAECLVAGFDYFCNGSDDAQA